MTATREELERVERRVDSTVVKFTDAFEALTRQLSEQTTQVALLCSKLDHNDEKFKALENGLNSHSKQIASLNTLTTVIESKQGGLMSMIEKVAYPIVIAMMMTYIVGDKVAG